MLRRSPLARPTTLLVLLGAVACAQRAKPAPETAPITRGAAADSCLLLSPPPLTPESITVAVTEPVDPAHAPRPGNAAERFVFAQLYESLLRIDCRGELRPALARAWSVDSTGRRVTLALRPGAWFTLRAPRDTQDLMGGSAIETGALDASVGSSSDAGTLVIELGDSTGAPDSVLADPESAAARTMAGTPWPEGTTGYTAQTTSNGVVRIAPRADSARPLLIVRTIPDRAARDLLDEGVDLLLTRDPAAVRYAATRGDLVSLALPFDREYVLLTPDSGPAWVTSDSTTASALETIDALRRTLATDVVREEARPAPMAYSSSIGSRCPRLLPRAVPRTPAVQSASRARRVVYPRDDAAARAIAERLVALSASHDPALEALAPTLARGAAPLAEPMSPDTFDRALASGSEMGYVMAVPARTLVPCRETARLLARAPWLIADTTAITTHVIPLIDTRPRAIVRRGALGLTIDGLGALHIVSSAGEMP